MKLDPATAEKLWDDFLERWRLDDLKSLTIEQYSHAGSKDTFTFWLESKTEALGSIWGGSAFKFGIYHRGSDEVKPNGRGRIFGDDYGWYEKYGKTPQEAFEHVRAEIIRVAEAARAERFQDIDAADLGQAVKWKIAFLYQPKDNPALLPIFKLEVLQALTGKKDGGYPELYAILMSDRNKTPLFSFAANLWEQGMSILDQQLSRDDAFAYLEKRFRPIKEHVKYMAGFETESGRQIGLVRQGSDVTAFVEPGNWESVVPGLQLKKRYTANEARISSLQANAPTLAEGHPADLLRFPSMAALTSFCDAYDSGSLPPQIAVANEASSINLSIQMTSDAMNKILYGPPGTGKTYKTAELAVGICDGVTPASRPALMDRYELLRKEGRISFVTFHQSYGYEDFVEGLRPESKDGQISYSVRPGIFREACDSARLRRMLKPGLTGKPLKARTVYKMSLGQVDTVQGKQALQACLENGYVVLGWGNDIDFSECKTADDIRDKIKEDRPNGEKPESQARYVTVFKDELKIGDIIVVSQGNTAFRAIGEVSGEYQFQDPPVAGAFHQLRAVRWLAVFETNRNVEEIFDRSFSQPTLYRLDSDGLKFDVIEALITGEAPTRPQNNVLIIDEINRAHISKVFGELITLLEPDKREGQLNAITVKLPYSGDSFNVPSNLYVIGTMNTADRSIALLDTALRRRFEFEELQPDYSTVSDTPIDGVNLRAMLMAMNDRVEYLYDRDHTLGHAYFMNISSLEQLDAVFRRKVLPLLQEYFYEDWSKIRLVLGDQVGNFVTTDESVPKGLDVTLDGMDVRVRYRIRTTPFPTEAYLNIYK